MNNTIKWNGYEIQPEYLITGGLTLAAMVTSVFYRWCINTASGGQPKLTIELRRSGTDIGERTVTHQNTLHTDVDNGEIEKNQEKQLKIAEGFSELENRVNELSTKFDSLLEIHEKALEGQANRDEIHEKQVSELFEKQAELSSIILQFLDSQKKNVNA